MRRFHTGHFVILYSVFALYLAARLWGMTASCLWFDEIFSVHAAEHAWDELFPFVALDLIHPPLFYALLKVWITIGGEGLLWLRLLPVIFAVIAIVPLTLLSDELKLSFWTRVLALFLLATNGSLIKYSEEVRMYSMLMCLSLFSLWLFVRFMDRGVGIVALTIVNLLTVYTHYFGWLVIAAEVTAILMFRRDDWRRIGAMTVAVLVGFLPWILAVWNAAAGGSGLGQNIGWMPRPDVRSLVQFALTLIEPFYYQTSSVSAASDYQVSIPILLIVLAIVTVYFSTRAGDREERRPAQLLAVFIGVPALIAFAASWLLPYSIWGTRHLIIVFAPVALLAAVGVTSVQIAWLRTSAVTLLLLFSGFAFFKFAATATPSYSWCNWGPQAVSAAEADAKNIYVLEDLAAYHVWFALHQDAGSDASVAKIRNVPGVAEDRAYFLPRGFDDVRTVDLAEVRDSKLWLAYRAADIDRLQQPLKTFIDAGYQIAASSVVDSEKEKTIFVLLEKN